MDSLILSQGHSVHICTVQYVCIRYSRVEEGLGGSKRGWWVVEMGWGGQRPICQKIWTQLGEIRTTSNILGTRAHRQIYCLARGRSIRGELTPAGGNSAAQA